MEFAQIILFDTFMGFILFGNWFWLILSDSFNFFFRGFFVSKIFFPLNSFFVNYVPFGTILSVKIEQELFQKENN